MPGSPPTSTTEPATRPPPRTRSSPGRLVSRRPSGRAETSDRGRTPGPSIRPAAAVEDRTSSTKEFHSPHSGQRPSHFGDDAPQDWQAKTETGLGDISSG